MTAPAPDPDLRARITTDSIELRIRIEGTCDHGPKLPHEPRTECRHVIETNWGDVQYPEPRPNEGEVGHLILVSAAWVINGCMPDYTYGRTGHKTTITQDGARRFARLDGPAGSWTWELFTAHWADGKGPDLLIGRWPD